MKINKVLNEATIEQGAQEYGNQVKAAAKAVKADEVITPEEPYGVVEEALDDALEAAREAGDFGEVSGVNVLLIGRGGTGKTARVESWAKSRGVNLVQKDAKTLDPSDLGGIVGRKYDQEGNISNRATKLSNDEFDQLDKPNSVLFLDELNRAPDDVAGSLLTLINNHTVNDDEEPTGKRLLKGFLFTVAAINPPKPGNKVNELDNPMRSRFGAVEVDSDPDFQLKYFRKHYGELIQQMKDSGKVDRIEALEGRLGIAEKLLSDPRFQFDGDEEEEEAQDRGTPVLNARSLTNLLHACRGKKEAFLRKWSSFCNPDKYGIVEDILSDYVDVDDKANDALKYGDENPFAKKKNEPSAYDKIANLL